MADEEPAPENPGPVVVLPIMDYEDEPVEVEQPPEPTRGEQGGDGG